MTHAQRRSYTKSRDFVGVADEQPFRPNLVHATSNAQGIRILDETNSHLFEVCMSLYSNTFHGDADLSVDMIKQAIKEGEMFVLCLPDQDGITPIGVAILADLSGAHEKPFVMLDYFFINPAKRGKGIGSAFFDSVIKYLNENSTYECLILECVDKLVGFYSRLGAIKTKMAPSLCIQSMSDLPSKVSSKSCYETLLYLMAVPLRYIKSEFPPTTSTLEPIVAYARTHVHKMERFEWSSLTTHAGNNVVFRAWSRK